MTGTSKNFTMILRKQLMITDFYHNVYNFRILPRTLPIITTGTD